MDLVDRAFEVLRHPFQVRAQLAEQVAGALANLVFQVVEGSVDRLLDLFWKIAGLHDRPVRRRA
ncbi:hypothetical protein TH66_22815 [Carbonactinospora thermoautotrophica]|uniref:Uncharacterized protein n=1 Tax=Carbonactinospora thermoautotrophica TaxID=1469144 RepID=A0A132NIY1_9ACTN|nr:hypothetical protein TH66_22815 [Carbonactinospora thermoautotrophica]KWX09986.1 hypothetical protein TR74_06360 [Carbonactinospora thermoautotrophica]